MASPALLLAHRLSFFPASNSVLPSSAPAPLPLPSLAALDASGSGPGIGLGLGTIGAIGAGSDLEMRPSGSGLGMGLRMVESGLGMDSSSSSSWFSQAQAPDTTDSASVLTLCSPAYELLGMSANAKATSAPSAVGDEHMFVHLENE